MRKLSCFVIMPSNRDGQAVKLARDDRRGLMEAPSGCQVSGGSPIEVNFDVVYEEIIKAALDQVSAEYAGRDIVIECTRGQDLPETGDIVRQLIEQICKADITITDITAHNPNVFLEYGIRLSVKDPLNILIRHEGAELPFNIEQQRCIAYTTDLRGARQARADIASFLGAYLARLDDSRRPVESSNFYKGYVEIFSGRQLERELIHVFQQAPQLVASFIQFLFVNGTSVRLRQEAFKFLETVEEELRKDPQGQQRAIEHLEMVSRIQGLSREKLQDVYYKLWELCDADDTLKDKGQDYLRKLEEMEGN